MTARSALLLLAFSALCRGEIYLEEKQAVEMVLHGCESVSREEKTVLPVDRTQLEKVSGLRVPIPRYTFFVCTKGEGAPRYAVVMNEIGKSEPITFLVGVDGSGKAGTIAVMIFRESRGWEVKSPRFTGQFRGKRLGDPIRINQDIMNLTGATLSSEAIARGVKKALALVHFYYLKK